MSTLLPFRRNYLRYNNNIHSRLTLQRKSRLCGIVEGRPWAGALDRLLAERRGLKKGELAKLAGVRPGTISAVANSPKPPEIRTLQALADALTAYDRRGNATAPAVELWEFFVSDEQAAALRHINTAKADALRQSQPATMADTLQSMQRAIVTLQQQLTDLEQKRRTG